MSEKEHDYGVKPTTKPVDVVIAWLEAHPDMCHYCRLINVRLTSSGGSQDTYSCGHPKFPVPNLALGNCYCTPTDWDGCPYNSPRLW